MKFRVETLGCKVNEYESRYYEKIMQEAGYEKAGAAPADICIVNSCTVTNTAASKSRQKLAHLKKSNPDALMVLVGCYAQALNEEQRKNLQVDVVIGASHKKDLVSLIEKALQEHSRIEAVDSVAAYDTFEQMPIDLFESRIRAFLKVEDGCNQFCSYCAIPLVRGRERSLSAKSVIEQARELEARGHKEIVLTGIHTGRYASEGRALSDLLKELLENTGPDMKYRISSIEITEVDDALIDLMANNPRILPHLHIPIQSGSNATLKRMHRPYSVEEFKERTACIRSRIPNVSISSDVIAGFVQESEEEFQETLTNLEEIGFSFLHVFPYSKRDDTAAAAMKGHLNGTIIKERAAALLDLSARLRQKDMERFDKLEVLIEQKTSKGYTGYSAQYHPIRIESSLPLYGRMETGYDAIENGTYIVRKKGKGNATV